MKMPVHMFISIGNILASQFKKEAEQQKKDQEGAMQSVPNLRQMTDMSNLSSLSSSLSGFTSSLPNMPNMPTNLSGLPHL